MKNGAIKRPKHADLVQLAAAVCLFCVVCVSAWADETPLPNEAMLDGTFLMASVDRAHLLQPLSIPMTSFQHEASFPQDLPTIQKIKSRKVDAHHQRLNNALKHGSRIELNEAELRLRSAYERAQSRQLSIVE